MDKTVNALFSFCSCVVLESTYSAVCPSVCLATFVTVCIRIELDLLLLSISLSLAVVGIWNEENVRHGYVEVSCPDTLLYTWR